MLLSIVYSIVCLFTNLALLRIGTVLHGTLSYWPCGTKSASCNARPSAFPRDPATAWCSLL